MSAPGTLDLAGIRARAEAATLRPTPYDSYLVDADGAVWSDTNWRGYGRRKLTPSLNGHGYPVVRLLIGDSYKKKPVHTLVCEAFHGPRPSRKHQVRHLNGLRTDPRSANLSWGTPAENARDRQLHGTEKAAENGRKSAGKLLGRYRPQCIRGHDKEGKRSCEQCRRDERAKNPEYGR